MVATAKVASPVPRLCPSPCAVPEPPAVPKPGQALVGGECHRYPLPQASQNQIAESEGLEASQAALQVNSRHALPTHPQKKLGRKKQLFIRFPSWTEGCSLNAVGSYAGRRGLAHCLQAARLALPFTQPGAHCRSQWRLPCQAPCSSGFETPLVPALLTESSRRVESALHQALCWVFPLRYYFKKASDEFRPAERCSRGLGRQWSCPCTRAASWARWRGSH